jgi:small subunit ribosomal protein S3e
MRQLGDDGYSGVEIRVTPKATEVIVRATKTGNVLGERGRRIRELTSMVQKRFGYEEGAIELYAERVQNRGLSAVAQAESLRVKMILGLPVRRVCYGVMRQVLEAGGKGIEITISGKLRSQRAKTMKFRDGYMIKSGQPSHDFVDHAIRSVLLRQGILGIQVAIMLPSDPQGKRGPKHPLPDVVKVHKPKEDNEQPHTVEQSTNQQ